MATSDISADRPIVPDPINHLTKLAKYNAITVKPKHRIRGNNTDVQQKFLIQIT
jgi:hypothetical protein